MSKLSRENWVSLVVVLIIAVILFVPNLGLNAIGRLLAAEGLILVCIFGLYLFEKERNREITEEKVKAVRLLESRVAAIEAAGDAIGIVDENGMLVFMNKALMEVFGIDPNEKGQFLNHPALNLFSENGRMDMENNLLPYLEEYKYWQGVSPLTRKDGKVIKAELSLTKLPDGGMIGTARDISEREQFDKEKQQLEAQLFQAQKMEAVGRLAGGIAHDFNNILAAMNGYAEFLKEDLPADSPEKGFAENILQAGRQAKDLVDQMLAFSRQKQSAHEQLDIAKVLGETTAMLAASLPKAVELQTDFQAEHTVMEGNDSQVAQMIMNLCVNAKDAMVDEHGVLTLKTGNGNAIDQGWEGQLMDDFLDPSETPPLVIEEIDAVRTRLWLGAIAKDKTYIWLSVEDDGTGMSAVIMENIFEPFFTTKPVDKGTGLGLSTALGVIAAHHGALLLESELGKGTCFKIFFPVSEKKEEQIVEGPPDTEESFLPARLLLVEDQENVRTVLERSLLRYGYDVDVCENGLEGLAVLRDCKGEYDLVVTDHSMPKMSGLEMISQIHIEDPDLEFVVLSGYAQEKLRAMTADHEAVKAVLRKPVSKNILHETIQSVLQDRKRVA